MNFASKKRAAPACGLELARLNAPPSPAGPSIRKRDSRVGVIAHPGLAGCGHSVVPRAVMIYFRPSKKSINLSLTKRIAAPAIVATVMLHALGMFMFRSFALDICD
jgi:hypothetical protein